VYTTRNGFSIFDLTQTLDAIEKAKAFLKEAAKTGKPILIVGTKPASMNVAKAFGEKFNMPYVTERWLGGTLTNFDTITARLQYYMKLKADQAAGRLDKYTKKERTAINKELERLTRFFGGLEKLTMMPAALIALGADANKIAIAEANRARVPVVAIANTNANPDTINHLIPASDNNAMSLAWILAKLEPSIEEGLKEHTLNVVPVVKK
jgi:small subunit ribosomal protein S2